MKAAIIETVGLLETPAVLNYRGYGWAWLAIDPEGIPVSLFYHTDQDPENMPDPYLYSGHAKRMAVKYGCRELYFGMAADWEFEVVEKIL
jgi:hypothetical protein